MKLSDCRACGLIAVVVYYTALIVVGVLSLRLLAYSLGWRP